MDDVNRIRINVAICAITEAEAKLSEGEQAFMLIDFPMGDTDPKSMSIEVAIDRAKEAVRSAIAALREVA